MHFACGTESRVAEPQHRTGRQWIGDRHDEQHKCDHGDLRGERGRQDTAAVGSGREELRGPYDPVYQSPTTSPPAGVTSDQKTCGAMPGLTVRTLPSPRPTNIPP